MVAGVVWAATTAQTADRAYVQRAMLPSYTGRWRPIVLVDAGHYNVHTASGTYEPFAELLRRDGYRVSSTTAPFSTASLQAARVLVVANALGWRGVLQQTLGAAGLERGVALRPSAMSRGEIAEIAQWVRGGGALLLVADHAPAGEAARALAQAFGVEMRNWWAEDEQQHDAVTGNPGFLVFTADSGLIRDHPIMIGRSRLERIARVITFTGQALRAPPNGASLLTLSPTAREYPYRRSREREGRSAAGLSQAVAVQHGRGRVVALGDAAVLTAQVTQLSDGSPLRFGISREDTQNRQFALNILHWLSGLL